MIVKTRVVNIMSGKAATDVFPDLHHKMSKKIAQLTKVGQPLVRRHYSSTLTRCRFTRPINRSFTI